MHAQQAPSEQAPSPTPLDIYRTYESVLPGWLYRFGISSTDTEDTMQEVWLGICDGSVPIPKTVQDARLELVKVTRRIAMRTRWREQRDALQHVPEPDECADDLDEEEHVVNALGVFNALERLAAPYRELVQEHYVLGYSIADMAKRAKTSESTMRKRVWRATAELEKLRQHDQTQEERPKKKRKSGLLIAPCAMELDPATRATFCAIWDAEGRLPEFGGPKDPPHPPVPWFANALPAVSHVARGITLKVSETILVLLLLLTSAGAVALIWFWEPTQVDSARSGLRVPQPPVVSAIDDVEPYPAKAPAAPSARASAPKTTPKPSQALDDDALDKLDGSGLTHSGSGSE